MTELNPKAGEEAPKLKDQVAASEVAKPTTWLGTLFNVAKTGVDLLNRAIKG